MKTFSQFLLEDDSETFADWKEIHGHNFPAITVELRKPKSDDFIYDAIIDMGIKLLHNISTVSPELQKRLVDWNGMCITYFKDPVKEVVKTALTKDNFIKYWPAAYKQFVTEYFKDNSILMNKWLRYADNMNTVLWKPTV